MNQATVCVSSCFPTGHTHVESLLGIGPSFTYAKRGGPALHSYVRGFAEPAVMHLSSGGASVPGGVTVAPQVGFALGVAKAHFRIDLEGGVALVSGDFPRPISLQFGYSW